jgi:hypothetical protein
MNKAITDGLALMPPAFSAGLDQWSGGDGTPGAPTYEGTPYAAFVPADQDFAGCLELMKVSATQKLRHTGQTPILPGCYLRIRVRVKAVSGNLPAVRIAAWAGAADGGHLAGVVETGPEVQLTSYGQVETLEAIVGTGARSGVDMPWGSGAAFGHFGLDLTGPDGGIVRIDDIEIEDVTSVFLRDMMGWVDVRDYGAAGDGVTDDRAAFLAADAAAAGRRVFVPEGLFRIASSITLDSPVRFEGRLSMPVEARLSLMKNFDLPSYIEAFGDEVEAFRKAVQALMNYTDHESLDMGGRRIQLDAPIDVQAAVDNKEVFEVRRVIRNGQFDPQPGPAWDDEVVTSAASYDPANPTVLTSVANVAQVPVGALVEGAGVGREVYVRSKNVGTGQVELSLPLHDAAGTQVYTFRRFKYVLDFSGFAKMQDVGLENIAFFCDGVCSAVMLPPDGMILHIRDCYINRPKDRGITSIGRACQGLLLDRNKFRSNEQPMRAQDRTSVAFNTNANDVKLRNNLAMRFRHFGVMHGLGHQILGNHWYQGDEEDGGLRTAGIVLTQPNCVTTISGNYVDNSFIEWGNEHDPAPGHASEYSFGALTITGNFFFTIRAASWFNWLVVKPYGPGHYIHGLTVSGNVFRTSGGGIDRVEAVDDSIAGLDMTRARNILFEGNTFNGIGQYTANPLILEHWEASPHSVWTVETGGALPFGGRAREVTAVVPTDPVLDAAGERVFAMPLARTEQGADARQVALVWPEPVWGEARLTVRMDNPA